MFVLIAIALFVLAVLCGQMAQALLTLALWLGFCAFIGLLVIVAQAVMMHNAMMNKDDIQQ